MQDFKSFWKIPHNVGFIQVKIQPFWHHLQFFSIDGVGVFQNSSQCRIHNVFEKFLTMLDLSRWKSNIVRNFCQAWTKSSLVSMSKISMVSSEASKNSKIQLCEEYLKNGLFFHFKIPHNAGFITFFSTTCRPLLAGLAPPHCVSLHRSKSFTASFRSFGYCSRIWIDVLEMHLEIWLHSFRPIYWSSLLTSEV